MDAVPAEPANTSPDVLSVLAHEVEEFVSTAGWDQAPQLFALVPTKELLQREPSLAGQVESDATYTPIAQEALSNADLGEALAGIAWPDTVAGCALAQEIVILPPEAEDQFATENENTATLHKIAAEHPDRREARLVAAVLRNGLTACVLRLRGVNGSADEFASQPDLAPNLTKALLETLRP